jgi:hypothetical protein
MNWASEAGLIAAHAPLPQEPAINSRRPLQERCVQRDGQLVPQQPARLIAAHAPLLQEPAINSRRLL